jgi:quercetin dioxygenase-like cupin family protein
LTTADIKIVKHQIIQYLIILALGTVVANAHEKHLGREFTLKEITPITELTEHPEHYFNCDVKIEGIIASACTNEGCFIEVISKDGKGEGVVINFPELAETFPTDCAGHKVIVEGMFYQKIYPSSRVLHWQGHSFRKGMHVPEFSLIRRIIAKAVTIGTETAALPEPGKIHEASVDHVDLNTMEFEAEGFGTGKKLLKPGEITEEHSTGNSREILFCLEGTLTVLKSGSEPVNLTAGEMSYIPPSTKHEIKNLSDKPAVYIFVFARKIEAEKKEHEH